MKPPVERVTAFAPGCIGNVGPGLDILGLALTGPGDRVTAVRRPVPGIRIVDSGHPGLPDDPDRHTAGIAAREVLQRAGGSRIGVDLSVTKGLPLAGGQGGSAASAVAAAVAVNRLLGVPLEPLDLLRCCLTAEEAVAGRHLDNIAPSLLGGVVLIRTLDPIEVVPLEVAENITIVLAHPDHQLETRQGRAALPGKIDREVALYQAAQVATMVAAFASGDLALLGRAIDDRIAEPYRAPLLPGFLAAKSAAIQAGALGCSISGSGPTAFAITPAELASPVAAAMVEAYARAGIQSQTRVATVDRQGARLEEAEQ